MNKPTVFFVGVFFASMVLAAAQVSRRDSRDNRDTRTSTPSYTDRYGVLWERNIFVRDRTRPTTGPGSLGYVAGAGAGTATTQVTRTDPEHSIALTGIVFEDNAYRAYVENISSGVVTRLSLGDAVARGKVAEIALDGITYDRPGAPRTWIDIGNDLANAPVTSWPDISEAAPTTSASTMPSGVDNLNPNDPTLTMEQKLKLRRMQELKGK